MRRPGFAPPAQRFPDYLIVGVTDLETDAVYTVHTGEWLQIGDYHTRATGSTHLISESQVMQIDVGNPQRQGAESMFPTH